MLLVVALVANLAAMEMQVSADPENLRAAADYRQAVIEAGDYDRAIRFFDGLTKRPGAGPHVLLSLGLAYIDKIPAVGAFRRISLGNNATEALTRSIAREPSDLAYLIRGLVNLHFEKGLFHRTPEGVADLENALRLTERSADASRSNEGSRSHPLLSRIYVALGDGYWRLKNHEKARATWRDGQMKFPGDDRLRLRLTSSDDAITSTIAHDLDASVRVDTSLRELE
jgi:hypothetical protein